MPAYSNSTPPLSLFPGDVGFSFNAEAFPANGTAGAQFAIPEPAGMTDQSHTVRWQTHFRHRALGDQHRTAGRHGRRRCGIFRDRYVHGHGRGSADSDRRTRAISAHQGDVFDGRRGL